VSTASTAPAKCYGLFEVIDTIGSGGHATVYKVRHKQSGAIAAIKVGPHFLWLEPGATERFWQEYKAIAPLSHPSIVRALGWGERDGTPYLVLEYVPGQNLGECLKEHGALPTHRTIAVFRQIADGLRYLHAHQIVHRDIKPSNILITTYDQAKLVDFGLLKNLKAENHLTQSRKGMGTFDYGAPEQFEDAKRADRRCDVFSLAATFYTALTAARPFGSGNYMQIMQRKLLNQFVPLRLLLPSLDPAIDELVNRCLQPNPSDRPRSCDEFITVLRGSFTGPAPEPS
jgi:eukaryotic-like serine/threonine-protein kinase